MYLSLVWQYWTLKCTCLVIYWSQILSLPYEAFCWFINILFAKGITRATAQIRNRVFAQSGLSLRCSYTHDARFICCDPVAEIETKIQCWKVTIPTQSSHSSLNEMQNKNEMLNRYNLAKSYEASTEIKGHHGLTIRRLFPTRF